MRLRVQQRRAEPDSDNCTSRVGLRWARRRDRRDIGLWEVAQRARTEDQAGTHELGAGDQVDGRRVADAQCAVHLHAGECDPPGRQHDQQTQRQGHTSPAQVPHLQHPGQFPCHYRAVGPAAHTSYELRVCRLHVIAGCHVHIPDTDAIVSDGSNTGTCCSAASPTESAERALQQRCRLCCGVAHACSVQLLAILTFANSTQPAVHPSSMSQPAASPRPQAAVDVLLAASLFPCQPAAAEQP